MSQPARFCIRCGAAIPVADSRFCFSCGAEIVSTGLIAEQSPLPAQTPDRETQNVQHPTPEHQIPPDVNGDESTLASWDWSVLIAVGVLCVFIVVTAFASNVDFLFGFIVVAVFASLVA